MQAGCAMLTRGNKMGPHHITSLPTCQSPYPTALCLKTSSPASKLLKELGVSGKAYFLNQAVYEVSVSHSRLKRAAGTKSRKRYSLAPKTMWALPKNPY